MHVILCFRNFHFVFATHICLWIHLETNKKRKTNYSEKIVEYLMPHVQRVPESPRLQKVIKRSVIYGNFKWKYSWNKFFFNIKCGSVRTNSMIRLISKNFLEWIFWWHIKRGLIRTNSLTILKNHWNKFFDNIKTDR